MYVNEGQGPAFKYCIVYVYIAQFLLCILKFEHVSTGLKTKNYVV